MKNKSQRGQATASRGRFIAASLLAAAPLASFMTLSAHAQSNAAPVVAPAASQVVASPPAAPLQDNGNPLPPKAQAFETAPSAARATQPTSASIPAANSAPAATAAPNTRVLQGEDIPWALRAEDRPWPLAYAELNPLNALYFALPTEKDARFMLPGYVADAAERARFTATRYITDNIGSAAQIRGRQLETFNVWADSTTKKKQLLPKDPWAVYQFNREALATLKVFKDKVASQTEPTVQKMAQDVKLAVEKISPLMEVMSSYELKMQWYNVLVQLKEGVGLYQTRVSEADRQILDAIAAFERDNPPVARPEGTPPSRNDVETGRQPAPIVAAPHVAMTPVAPREAAEPPSQKNEPHSSTGGIVVLMGMGAAVIGLFFRLRKRLAKKSSSTKGTGN